MIRTEANIVFLEFSSIVTAASPRILDSACETEDSEDAKGSFESRGEIEGDERKDCMIESFK